MTKSVFIRNTGKRVVALCLLILLVLSLTGCGVDNTTINKAFANSSIMKSILAELQGQLVLIDDLKRSGVITPEMANTMNAQINSIVSTVGTLTGDVTVQSPNTSTDPNATPTPVTIDGAYNNFIGTVLKSMSWLRDTHTEAGFAKVTGLDKTDTAKLNVDKYGDRLDIFQGYPTKLVIEKSEGTYSDGTKYDFKKNNNSNYKGIAGYLPGKTAVPLKPLGDDKTATSTVEALVKRINSLSSVQVCYLNPNRVQTSADIQRLRADMDLAMSGKMSVSEFKGKYFMEASGGKVNLATTTLSSDNAYRSFEITVKEGDVEVAKYMIMKLDEEKIRAAFNGALQTSDTSSGVLLENYYFVTKYPVAVFRGFEQSTLDNTQYFPVFTHPKFLLATGSYYNGTNYLVGTEFQDSGSGYTEIRNDYDKGTAEQKAAYVDLYDGKLYYSGEKQGSANAYMSIGVADLESVVLIRPSSKVYLVSSNKAAITTVTQSSKFTPTQTVHVTDTATVKLPSVRGWVNPM